MSRLSVKMRVTIWYTAFMLVVVALLLYAMLAISRSVIDTDIRNELTRMVQANSDEVDFDDGELDLDDDFVFYRDGVYTLIYDAEGYLLYGSAMNDLPVELDLVDGEIRSTTHNGETYYVYDRQVAIKKGDVVWLRGISSADDSYSIISTITRISLVAIPLILLIAAAGGYYIAKRAFKPVERMNRTVSEINEGSDLSKRIDVGSGKDEIHELADNFNHMFRRLESSFEAEKQFTADASHELRTPTSVILAQCELALDGQASQEEYIEALELIQRQAGKMSGIIGRLLAITRLDQRVDKLNLQPTDLSGLVGGICDEYKQSGIRLHSNIQPGISANVDKTLTGSMLANLLQNAIKYGGDKIEVGLDRKGNSIRLWVWDDGPGIPAEHQAKVWNRFYQADPSREANADGSNGLGLAMVKQIAELHGGSVALQSKPGEGSRFSINLPANQLSSGYL